MARKTVSISEEAYQFIKARGDDAGMTMGEIVEALVDAERVTAKPKVAATKEDTALQPEEVDKAMGYERKPQEVTLRDGLSGFYSLSYGSKDMGRDDS